MKKILFLLAATVIGLTVVSRAHDEGHEDRGERSDWRHREFRNKNLSFSIDYLDPWGHTIADASGLHFYADKLSAQWGVPVMVTNDPTQILPSRFWGTYPLYYTGMTMDYKLTLHNESHRTLKDIDIRVVQAYLNTNGGFSGAKIGSDAVRDFIVPKIKGNETLTFDGSIAIPVNGQSGLDQTDLIVFKQDKDRDDDGDFDEVREHPNYHRVDGHVIFWEPQLGIWCPPSLMPQKP